MSFFTSIARNVLQTATKTASHSAAFSSLSARHVVAPSTLSCFIRSNRRFPTPSPSLFSQSAGIRIKASDSNAENAKDKKQATEQQKPSEDDAADAQGLDLFAQAMANQKRRDADTRKAAAGEQTDAEATEGPAVDPAEAERLRKWREVAEEEEKKQMIKSGRLFLGSAVLVGLAGYIYLGLPDEDQKREPGESFLTTHNSRALANLKKWRSDITSPALEKLLPDPLPVPYQRPLTLCIELNEALVHLEWDKAVGWRVATRPGVKQFLANLSRYYEVVIFTNSPGYLAEPVCQALDPHFFYAMYRLYRDHTKLVDGVYVKDLSQLNRDLGKTIILDTNPGSYKLQPENGLQLKSWKGERTDKELRKLETFFEELYVFMTVYGIEDVRPILNIVNSINPNDIAAAWTTYKQTMREEFAKRQQEQQGPAKSSRSWISTLLGGGASQQQQSQVMNVIDQIEAIAREERELAIKDAEAMKQQMQDMQKQQEEFIKKQMEENKNKGLKLWDYINGAGAPVPPGQQPPAGK
ncbi:hypothetical protein SpCBS45565_g01282 [Spizellomyces sp. 'palustris']|nr:hypothetical protein SpCBS45565_g01282 [Spizellomyces sp. 'palustris']